MAKTKEVFLNLKYAALRYLIYIMYGIAGLLLLMGLYLLFNFYLQEFAPEMYKGIGIFGFLFSLLMSFMIVVQAQVLQLFLDLEWNQRESIELQKQIIEALPDKE